MSQRVNRHVGFIDWLREGSGKGKAGAMSWQWRTFPKYYNRGGYECVSKLYVRGAEAMNMQESHLVNKIATKGRPVIYIHEFRRDQPDSKTALLQPVMTEQQEVAIEPSKA